ncbi:MATE family efflux transporter [Kitasatospora sp. NPDC085879]|uniref:MATE family efflux transporter n=1 Tax=Kitasatospora sp. NPDC085879 TaxID=3154769 RepID=UPI003449ED7E
MRRLSALAGPVYLELLSGVAASVVGTFWVAGLGGNAVAAVALGGAVENLLLGLILVVSSGAALRLSHALGAGDTAAAGRVARAAWRLWAAAVLLLAVPGFLLREPLARLFLDGPAAALAAAYFAVAMPGLTVFFAQRVADDLFKGTGDTRTPMRLALLGNGLLLVLDPLLVLGPGPLPALGVTGAAVALVASRTVALAVTLALRRRAPLRSPGGRGAATAGRVLAAGAPFGIDFTARMAVGTAQLGLVAAFGIPAVAGYGIGYRVLLVATMALYAVRQAAAIEAARLAGADRPGALAALTRDTARLAGAAGAVAAVVCAGAAVPLAALFTDDPAVAAQTVGYLRMAALYLPPYALVVALGGVRQATGRGRALVAATMTGLAVQLAAAHGLSGPAGVDGIWAANALGALVQLALLGLLPRRGADRRPAPSGAGLSSTGTAQAVVSPRPRRR